MFLDKVWAMEGAYIKSWVIVKEDGLDRYWLENL
jgi:hypothetical protein